MNSSCHVLNQFGCFVYNRHLMFSLEGRKKNTNFEVGDKVICTKNNDVPIYTEYLEENSESRPIKFTQPEVVTDGKYVEPENLRLVQGTERLMNGNLYKVRASVTGYLQEYGNEETFTQSKVKRPDNHEKDHVQTHIENGIEKHPRKQRYFVLDDLAGEIVRVDYDSLLKKSRLKHAWTINIHKFQGSEADSVVYCLSGSQYETWRHVYTAVTRGKKKVTIIGSEDELQRADNKSKTDSISQKVAEHVEQVSDTI